MPSEAGRGGGPDLEEREVRAADPDLSPETNAALTEELRATVGADRVSVPVDRPRAAEGEHPHPRSPVLLSSERVNVMLRGFVIALTIGAILALSSGDWWLLPLAAGVHALGTMLITGSVLRLTTVTEHPAPEVAAAMAQDGVASPDMLFSSMVDEFRPESGGAASEVLSPGQNERTTEASEDPLRAGAEQSAAMTPSAEPSHSGGEGGTPDAMIWATIASLAIATLVLPAVGGGVWLWLTPAIVLPLLAGWAYVQRLMITDPERLRVTPRRMVAVAVVSVLAVMVFCVGVAAFVS